MRHLIKRLLAFNARFSNSSITKARMSTAKTATLGLGAAATFSGATFLYNQYRAKINGSCEFSEHTRQQHQEHFITGMHAPFITKDKESLELFHQHFEPYAHLLPSSAEALAKQHALKTPVEIKLLSDCPVSVSTDNTLLAVGGPPALMAATAHLEKNGAQVIYLNDERRWPIANGSAWHLEQDADAEAPTTYSPMTFMGNQLLRAFIKREKYEEIERTGLYPWRTLDWIGYLKHPEQWLSAFKVAINFQLRKLDPKERQAQLDQITAECILNEIFYNNLNDKLGGKLLLPGRGAIIVARNEAELNDLHQQQKNLEKEGRKLTFLTRDEIIKRFGFPLEGIGFAEKPHDRILSPEYKSLLSSYIKQQGGTVINGTLTTVYSDGKNKGGMAEYVITEGKKHYVPFGQLIMSLGNQAIKDLNKKPLFDVIGATGSSGLSFIYTPQQYKLPRVAVFGATNHMSRLSVDPVSVMHEGKPKHLHFVRFTSGACITPVYRGEEGGYHDSTISLGLMNTVYKTLGKECIVKPLALYGCGRVVSQYGQLQQIQVYPGIFVYFGAGGGGLTRAPNQIESSFKMANK